MSLRLLEAQRWPLKVYNPTTCKEDKQLLLAGILSARNTFALYGLENTLCGCASILRPCEGCPPNVLRIAPVTAWMRSASRDAQVRRGSHVQYEWDSAHQFFNSPGLDLPRSTPFKMFLFFFPLLFSLIFGHQQHHIQPDPLSRVDGAMYREPYLSHDPNTRTEFLPLSCKTTAYPSSGGIVLGYFSAIELAHLNLSRTIPANRSSDPAEEDNLALGMLRLGAHWWPSWELYARHREQIMEGIPYDFHFPPIVNVGYPSSGKGVWVVKFSVDQQTWDDEDGRKPYLSRKPDDWDGKMRMALTMDERCEVLKGFGATFYETVEDCEDIPKTLLEGIRKGRQYEELLKKMEDMNYVDRWLSGCRERE